MKKILVSGVSRIFGTNRSAPDGRSRRREDSETTDINEPNYFPGPHPTPLWHHRDNDEFRRQTMVRANARIEQPAPALSRDRLVQDRSGVASAAATAETTTDVAASPLQKKRATQNASTPDETKESEATQPSPSPSQAEEVEESFHTTDGDLGLSFTSVASPSPSSISSTSSSYGTPDEGSPSLLSESKEPLREIVANLGNKSKNEDTPPPSNNPKRIAAARAKASHGTSKSKENDSTSAPVENGEDLEIPTEAAVLTTNDPKLDSSSPPKKRCKTQCTSTFRNLQPASTKGPPNQTPLEVIVNPKDERRTAASRTVKNERPATEDSLNEQPVASTVNPRNGARETVKEKCPSRLVIERRPSQLGRQVPGTHRTASLKAPPQNKDQHPSLDSAKPAPNASFQVSPQRQFKTASSEVMKASIASPPKASKKPQPSKAPSGAREKSSVAALPNAVTNTNEHNLTPCAPREGGNEEGSRHSTKAAARRTTKPNVKTPSDSNEGALGANHNKSVPVENGEGLEIPTKEATPHAHPTQPTGSKRPAPSPGKSPSSKPAQPQRQRVSADRPDIEQRDVTSLPAGSSEHKIDRTSQGAPLQENKNKDADKKPEQRSASATKQSKTDPSERASKEDDEATLEDKQLKDLSNCPSLPPRYLNLKRPAVASPAAKTSIPHLQQPQRKKPLQVDHKKSAGSLRTSPTHSNHQLPHAKKAATTADNDAETMQVEAPSKRAPQNDNAATMDVDDSSTTTPRKKAALKKIDSSSSPGDAHPSLADSTEQRSSITLLSSHVEGVASKPGDQTLDGTINGSTRSDTKMGSNKEKAALKVPHGTLDEGSLDLAATPNHKSPNRESDGNESIDLPSFSPTSAPNVPFDCGGSPIAIAASPEMAETKPAASTTTGPVDQASLRDPRFGETAPQGRETLAMNPPASSSTAADLTTIAEEASREQDDTASNSFGDDGGPTMLNDEPSSEAAPGSTDSIIESSVAGAATSPPDTRGSTREPSLANHSEDNEPQDQKRAGLPPVGNVMEQAPSIAPYNEPARSDTNPPPAGLPPPVGDVDEMRDNTGNTDDKSTEQTPNVAPPSDTAGSATNPAAAAASVPAVAARDATQNTSVSSSRNDDAVAVMPAVATGTIHRAPPPGYIFCAECKKDKPTSAFSKNQQKLHKQGENAKCMMVHPRDANENQSVKKCSCCPETDRNNFTKNQLAKKANKRKCRKCTEKCTEKCGVSGCTGKCSTGAQPTRDNHLGEFNARNPDMEQERATSGTNNNAQAQGPSQSQQHDDGTEDKPTAPTGLDSNVQQQQDPPEWISFVKKTCLDSLCKREVQAWDPKSAFSHQRASFLKLGLESFDPKAKYPFILTPFKRSEKLHVLLVRGIICQIKRNDTGTGKEWILRYYHDIKVSDDNSFSCSCELAEHAVSDEFVRILFTPWAYNFLWKCSEGKYLDRNTNPSGWIKFDDPGYYARFADSLTYTHVRITVEGGLILKSDVACPGYYDPWDLFVPSDQTVEEFFDKAECAKRGGHVAFPTNMVSDINKLHQEKNTRFYEIPGGAASSEDGFTDDEDYDYHEPEVPLDHVQEIGEYSCGVKSAVSVCSKKPEWKGKMKQLEENLLKVPFQTAKQYETCLLRVIGKNLKVRFTPIKDFDPLSSDPQKSSTKYPMFARLRSSRCNHYVAFYNGYLIEPSLPRALKITEENLKLLCGGDYRGCLRAYRLWTEAEYVAAKNK